MKRRRRGRGGGGRAGGGPAAGDRADGHRKVPSPEDTIENEHGKRKNGKWKIAGRGGVERSGWEERRVGK